MPAAGKKPQWLTETRSPLDLRTLWRNYEDPDELIGLRFGNETRYCLIDIDRGSAYHPANDFSGYKDVLAALENIGLCRPSVVRSSDSDGIHVYYFLPELLSSFNLACAVKFALEDTGLQLRDGQLESFPNVKAYDSIYNGCRLPLQAGSYLLDDDAQPLTNNDLTHFLNAADVAATHQDIKALKKALIVARKRFKSRRTPNPSTNVQRIKREIQELIAEGWTGRGQTNDLLIKIANDAVFWLGLHGEALIDHIEATAIAAPGYKEHCRHQHEIRKRAAEVAEMADGYWVKYCNHPDRNGRSYQVNFGRQGQQNNIIKFPTNQANTERSQQAAERIQQAVDHLKTTAMLPAGVTARAAAIKVTYEELFGKVISLETLYRPCHKSLWHPGCQESLEPAQGETLRAALNADCDQESLEPAQGGILRAVPPNEVCVCETCLSETPQKVSDKAEAVAAVVQEGEREGEILPVALPRTPQPVEKAAPTAPEQPVAPTALPAVPARSFVSPRECLSKVTKREDLSRMTPLLVKANIGARKNLEQLPPVKKQSLTREEREQREIIAAWKILWECGEPLWMDKARDFAIANPEALPEALPQPAESATESLPLKVGDRIWWDNCPGHCHSMNPFTIIAINGDMASLDVYSKPVPMSQLRRWIDSSC